jgi:diguanylate cyclase (GGDEF)-like protein/PAS domain S-box-containing protein
MSTTDSVLDRAAAVAAVRDVLDAGAVRSFFQPIVDLASRSVVAYEALARGPLGPLATPDALFAAAREAGLLAELDEACRLAAFEGASRLGLVAPCAVFVNVEPEVLDDAPLSDLLAIADAAPGELRMVIEITERALAARPAELLRTVERVRDLGWGVALDDVGADSASLAFMALLRPDVVKLDLSLVQDRPSPAIAEIMNAVNAYAERSGALILAEGIETERHLATAQGLGATLGQGWLFGRPTPDPVAVPPAAPLDLAVTRVPVSAGVATSPFSCLPDGVVLKTSSKRLLIELSKQLEREALRVGDTCIVASTFQHGRHFTPATTLRYRDLVERTGFVCALGEGLASGVVPGLRSAPLAADDPVLGEWDVVVLSPHFSTALLARDLGDSGPDMDRRFAYALTYERETVVRAAHGLLSRVAPRVGPAPGSHASHGWQAPDQGLATTSGGPAAPASGEPDVAPVASQEAWPPLEDVLARRAIGATTSGVTIADMTRPDQPLVFVNKAFEKLAGYRDAELLGRNCRFLQGPDTDPAALARMRTALAEGQECRETMVNYRGPERLPWWNEILLSPVHDEAGRVVHFIGVQSDVTARVEAERALSRETERGGRYLARIEHLAFHDSLTGLMNRRRFEEQVETALLESCLSGRSVALLFMDLDGFKAVNDTLGHPAGDQLLQETARRLRSEVRGTDLLGRFGGDEFVVALTGLDPTTAALGAERVSRELGAAIAAPFHLQGQEIRLTASIGIATYPADAADFGALLHLADARMFELKHPAARAR